LVLKNVAQFGLGAMSFTAIAFGVQMLAATTTGLGSCPRSFHLLLAAVDTAFRDSFVAGFARTNRTAFGNDHVVVGCALVAPWASTVVSVRAVLAALVTEIVSFPFSPLLAVLTEEATVGAEFAVWVIHDFFILSDNSSSFHSFAWFDFLVAQVACPIDDICPVAVHTAIPRLTHFPVIFDFFAVNAYDFLNFSITHCGSGH
jgi:hypothetical protein